MEWSDTDSSNAERIIRGGCDRKWEIELVELQVKSVGLYSEVGRSVWCIFRSMPKERLLILIQGVGSGVRVLTRVSDSDPQMLKPKLYQSCC
jgi:hypothetical protein